ncbi:hypothetical protein GCM10009827_021380 [Dactylosporangium maewongense]|uniref:Uncharacterized protein n=1 Tax=Dactylosporangium maewongense TaxID=634393 RepID=A0ABN1ZYB2_9ACTN
MHTLADRRLRQADDLGEGGVGHATIALQLLDDPLVDVVKDGLGHVWILAQDPAVGN